MKPFRFFGILTVSALAGCGRSSGGEAPIELPSPYRYAYAMSDCAPWDGPAVTIFLTADPATPDTVPYPQLRISIWRTGQVLPGNTFSWPGKEQVGAASRCDRENNCTPAAAGRVTFKAFQSDSALAGSFALRFPEGATTGGFRARWRGQRAFCG